MRASRSDAKGRTWRARFAAGVLSGSAAVLMLHAAEAAPAKPAASATPAKPAAAVAPAKAPAKVTAQAATAPTTRMSTPNAAVATKPSAVQPVRVAAGKGPGVQNAASIEQQVAYQYNALGRRDPFQPMAGGTFVGDDIGGDAPPDVGGIKVVGIIWGASDKFALVEDARGTSRVLRAGDKVMNGVVETLKRDAVIVNLTVDGQSEQISIPLTRKGDQTNANR